jgi:WD40 repeat protein
VAAGTYARSVLLFDTRVEFVHVKSYKVHQSSVIALSMCGDWIVSASEDRTVAVWDQRAGKVLKKIKLYENKVSLLQLEYIDTVMLPRIGVLAATKSYQRGANL